MLNITPNDSFLDSAIVTYDPSTTYLVRSDAMPRLQNYIDQNMESLSFPAIDQFLFQLESLDAHHFVWLLEVIVNSVKDEGQIVECVNTLLNLSRIKHSSNEVIIAMRTSNKIDSVFILTLCWFYPRRIQTLHIVDLILNVFSVDLLLNGKQVLSKWQEYVNQLCMEHELLAKLHAHLASAQTQSNYETKFEQYSPKNILIGL